jgi:hypothetical protein
MAEVKDGNEVTRGRSWAIGHYVEAGTVKFVMKLKLKGKGSGKWNRSVGPRRNGMLNDNRLWHFVKVYRFV